VLINVGGVKGVRNLINEKHKNKKHFAPQRKKRAQRKDYSA
jgi:hypothetical protein